MTFVKWDEPGERLYETGVDRGVLYILGGVTVAWNGITSVTEDTDRETKPCYIDGMKYMDHQVLGSFTGTLRAFTYPDAFDQCLGRRNSSIPGLRFPDQPPKTFSLSYRTRVGNDLEGSDLGYKIHILWNLTASQTPPEITTLSDRDDPTEFEWKLTGVPELGVDGIRPTAHIVIDSRTMSEADLNTVEFKLYGSGGEHGVAPGLDSMVDFMSIFGTEEDS